MSADTATPAEQHVLEHLYLVFYGDLGLCGCGNPETALTLIRDLLRLAPFHQDGHWQQVHALIGSDGAHHIVLSALDNADLIEHGGSIGGSWATDKGQWMLWAIEQAGDLDDLPDRLSMIGFPHDGDGTCSDDCWIIPSPMKERTP